MIYFQAWTDIIYHQFGTVIVTVANAYTYMMPTICHRCCKFFIHNNSSKQHYEIGVLLIFPFSRWENRGRKRTGSMFEVTLLSKWQSQDSRPRNLVLESISSLVGHIRKHLKEKEKRKHSQYWVNSTCSQCLFIHLHYNPTRLWTIGPHHASQDREQMFLIFLTCWLWKNPLRSPGPRVEIGSRPLGRRPTSSLFYVNSTLSGYFNITK